MAGWALGIAILALLWAGWNTMYIVDCQDDTDEHNEMLASLKRKLQEKKIID